jgi:anti-sigma28 factor (negative regulator of flagellin synthesis)
MKLFKDGEVISGEDVAVGVGATAAEKRENRIEELRRQVQNGSYEVDVHEVSKKIIDEHLGG